MHMGRTLTLLPQSGSTVLHGAAVKGCADVVQLMLERGANPRALSKVWRARDAARAGTRIYPYGIGSS